jgi:hypothetical protein
MPQENPRSPYEVSKDYDLLFKLVYDDNLEIILFSSIGVPYIVEMQGHILLIGRAIKTDTREKLKDEMTEHCQSNDLCFIVPNFLQ